VERGCRSWLIAFPSGRLESRGEWFVVATTYVSMTALQALPLLFGGGSGAQCSTCRAITAGIWSNAEVADAFLALQRSVLAVAGIGICVALRARWRRSTPTQRRAMAPILWCGGATAVLVCVAAVSESNSPYTLSGPLDWAWLVAFASGPFAFVSSLLHRRLHSGSAVSKLIERLGEPHTARGLDHWEVPAQRPEPAVRRRRRRSRAASLLLAERSRAGQAARSPATEGNLQRLGWLGSGAGFFLIVLLSIRTVVA
jgi:hypothetical protein